MLMAAEVTMTGLTTKLMEGHGNRWTFCEPMGLVGSPNCRPCRLANRPGLNGFVVV